MYPYIEIVPKYDYTVATSTGGRSSLGLTGCGNIDFSKNLARDSFYKT